MPDAYYPEDLLDPQFAPAISTMGELSADEWLGEVNEQVVDQYQSLKENPVAGGFFAAFLNPMVISGGAQMTLHPPKTTLHANVEVRLSTDGKLLVTGDLVLFDGLQRIPARIYADLSKIASGQAKLLLMAQDIPTGPSPLFPLLPTSAELKGAVTMRYLGPDGEVIDFFDPNPEPTGPTTAVVDPVEEGQISQGTLSEHGYLDVQFTPSPDAELNEPSILDAGRGTGAGPARRLDRDAARRADAGRRRTGRRLPLRVAHRPDHPARRLHRSACCRAPGKIRSTRATRSTRPRSR